LDYFARIFEAEIGCAHVVKRGIAGILKFIKKIKLILKIEKLIIF